MVTALCCCLSGLAGAESVRVERLRLDLPEGWRRAAIPATDEAWNLELPGSGGLLLQALVLRQTSPVKAEEATFYENLTRKWASLYGSKAAVGWIEAEGMRWRTCRRPSSERAATVFQMTTVQQGRAYTVMAYAPAETQALPKPVHELLRQARFGAPVARWKRVQQVRLQPYGEDLDALVQPDVERLAANGILSGYGVEFSDASFTWFLEGYVWRGQGRAPKDRQAVQTRGRVEWSAPANLEQAVSLNSRLDEGSQGAVALHLSLREVCAPPPALREALASLEAGERGPLDVLAATSACGAETGELRWQLRGGESARRVLSPGVAPDTPAGLGHIRVLEAGVKSSAGSASLGAALLERLGLVAVYAPEEPGKQGALP